MIDGSRYSTGVPSKALFGCLPLSRLLPQDAHSLIDYVGSVFVGILALFTQDSAAQYAAVGAMVFGLSASLLTDYRLSIAKIVPIEMHECLDYLLGGFLVAAPFLFGFAQNAPIISVLMSGSGLTLIIMALVTDYRAFSRRRS